MIRDGYQATYQGETFEASPDGDDLMRLYSTEPREGFAQVRDGRYVMVVPADTVTNFSYVRTTCMWKGEPFIILGEHDGWLRVEYTGGKAPVASTLGLEEFDFGVYQGWAPAADVSDVREYRV
jgi:hypothetical protein